MAITWKDITWKGLPLERSSQGARIKGTTKVFSGLTALTNNIKEMDANSLANLVSDFGIENLQNWSWWNDNPNKTSAWEIVETGSSTVRQPEATVIKTTTPTQTTQTTTTPTQTTSTQTIKTDSTDGGAINAWNDYNYQGLNLLRGSNANGGTNDFKIKGFDQVFDGVTKATDFVQNLDANQLSKLVQDQGIENLQSYSWWSNNPNKQDAWKTIEGGKTDTEGSYYRVEKGSDGSTQVWSTKGGQETYIGRFPENWDDTKIDDYMKEEVNTNITQVNTFQEIPTVQEVKEQQIEDDYGNTTATGEVYLRNKETGEVKFVAGIQEKIDTIREWGNANVTRSNRDEFESYQTISENERYDEFVQEYTRMQQYLANNPEALEPLLNDITIFDEYYTSILDDLKVEKQIQSDKIANDYQSVLDTIEMNESISDSQKEEQIKSLTSDFIDVNKELNFSSEIAYRNAAKSLQQSAEDAGNMASQNFLSKISKGVQEGGIMKFNADQLVRDLQSFREDTQDDFEIQQQQIEDQRRRAFRQLEDQVGTEEALRQYGEASQVQGDTSGLSQIEDQANISRLGINRTTPASQAGSGLQGSINLQQQAQSQQNELQRLQASQSKDLQTRSLQQQLGAAGASQAGALQDQLKSMGSLGASKARELTSFRSSQLQKQFPYISYKETSPGQFTFGQGGQSFAERSSQFSRNTLGTTPTFLI